MTSLWGNIIIRIRRITTSRTSYFHSSWATILCAIIWSIVAIIATTATRSLTSSIRYKSRWISIISIITICVTFTCFIVVIRIRRRTTSWRTNRYISRRTTILCTIIRREITVSCSATNCLITIFTCPTCITIASS